MRLINDLFGDNIPERECYTAMKYTAKQIGEIVKSARKSMGVTQKNLALTSGSGLRFIIELCTGMTGGCRLVLK